MINKTAIKTSHLIKTFSQNEIIKDCNLTVSEGTIYGLLGANGAGKTTLFKLLMGLLTPTAGRIQIQGKDLALHRDDILKHMGCIIEYPVFYEHLPARENLEIHLSYMDSKGQDISDTLEMVGLSSSNQQPVSKFSLGMRQRLGIARALIHKPRILLLDEPVNGLDPIGIRQMRELFTRLKKEQGLTLLLSSHILSEVAHIADRIGIMKNGRIAEEITVSTLSDQSYAGLEHYFFQIMEGDSENA